MSPRALERFKCEVKRSGPSEKKAKSFSKIFESSSQTLNKSTERIGERKKKIIMIKHHLKPCLNNKTYQNNKVNTTLCKDTPCSRAHKHTPRNNGHVEEVLLGVVG